LLERAIELHLGGGRELAGLGEWYIYQRKEPQKALELIAQANVALAGARLSARRRNNVLAFRYADEAWALAQLRRNAEAESKLAKAFLMIDASYDFGMASVHWTAGMTHKVMGQLDQAREHFSKAVRIDPHGRYGKLAARS
jgi:tetratricopeptide (TPR) repeat protein